MTGGALRLRSPHDREIARLAVPAFGALVAEPLYVLTDTAIVGRIGTDELGGLAVASGVILTTFAVLIFLAYGTTGTVARLIGAGRTTDAAHQGVQGLWLAIGFGVVVGAVFVAFPATLVGWFGAEPEVTGFAETYLRISGVGMPALLLTLAGTGYLRGVQDTRTPLVVAIATALLNLVVELVLVFGFDLGVAGSAWSTVLAQWAGAVVYVAVVTGAARRLGAALAPDARAIAAYLGVGVALIVRTTALRGAIVVATAMAANIGTVDLAAHQIGFEVWSLLALSLDAVAIAGQALTGKALGAGDVATARSAAERMVVLSIVGGMVAATLLIAVRGVVPDLFTNDPAVAALAAFVLLHVALMQPLTGLVFALDGILIGAGDLRFLAGAMVGSSLVFGLAAVVVASTTFTIGWLWGALWIFTAARAVPMVVRFRQGGWLVTGAVP